MSAIITQDNAAVGTPERRVVQWPPTNGGFSIGRTIAIPMDGGWNGNSVTRVAYRESPGHGRSVRFGLDLESSTGSVAPPGPWSASRQQLREVIHPSAMPLLTDRVKVVLGCLRDIMRRQARRDFIPVDRVEIGSFVDPEENVKQVVVTQWVRLPANSALRYWDRLGAAIEGLIRVLPPELASILEDRVAVEVRWFDDPAPVRPD